MTVKENSIGVEGLRLETRQPSVCWCSLIFEGPGRRGGSCQWVGVGSVAPRPNSCEESWQLQSLWDGEKEETEQGWHETEGLSGTHLLKALRTFSWTGSSGRFSNPNPNIMLGCHLNRSLASNKWVWWKAAAGKSDSYLEDCQHLFICEEGVEMENNFLGSNKINLKLTC